MKQAFLKRGFCNEKVTLGMLFVENSGQNRPFYTLEEPWKANQRKISCIPTGRYFCQPHNSERFKNVWRLIDVSNRDAILIHAGNTTDDIEGCILVGLAHGEVYNKPAVLKSREAMDCLRSIILPSESFYLIIT